MNALRPLDALRLLRDERCTATASQRLALTMIILRTDNASGKARFSMTTLAADMGVARRTVVTVVPQLVAGQPGLPLVVSRETGRKVKGRRRETNTYTLSVRPGWALDAYLNRDPVALGIQDPQPTRDLGSPTLGQYDPYVGDPVAQVLPSVLPSDLPTTEIPPFATATKGTRTSKPRTSKPRSRQAGPSSDVVRVFEAWKRDLAPLKFQRPVELTLERRKAIERALKDHSVADLELVFKGVRNSAFHCGQNDSGEKHVDLPTIFKAKMIEAHIARASQPAAGSNRSNGALLQRPAAEGEYDWKTKLLPEAPK